MSEAAKMAGNRGMKKKTARRFPQRAGTVIVRAAKLLLSVAVFLAGRGWAEDSKTGSWIENESIRLGVIFRWAARSRRL